MIFCKYYCFTSRSFAYITNSSKLFPFILVTDVATGEQDKAGSQKECQESKKHGNVKKESVRIQNVSISGITK